MMTTAASESGVADSNVFLLEREITGLVFKEARLLDEWKLDDWLALFAEDATYWIPMDERGDPTKVASIIFDEKTGLVIRVEQLMRQNRTAQSPRSEIVHQVSNLEIDLAADGNAADADYNLSVIELRTGDWRQKGLGTKRFYVGRCKLRLKNVGGKWLIDRKTIILLERHQPVESLSFLL